MNRRHCLTVLASAIALGGTSLASAQVKEITGAGATFPAPLYARWAADYNKATGVRMNYQSIGSGGGLRQIRGKTVQFGASDMPLTDAELAKDGLIQFPTVISVPTTPPPSAPCSWRSTTIACSSWSPS